MNKDGNEEEEEYPAQANNSWIIPDLVQEIEESFTGFYHLGG